MNTASRFVKIDSRKYVAICAIAKVSFSTRDLTRSSKDDFGDSVDKIIGNEVVANIQKIDGGSETITGADAKLLEDFIANQCL